MNMNDDMNRQAPEDNMITCASSDAGQNTEKTGSNGDGRIPNSQNPKHTKPKWIRGTALALCCAIIGGAAGAGAYSILSGSSGSSTPSTTTLVSGNRAATIVLTSEVDTSQEMTAAEVYAQNVNSTVGITTTTTTNYWGYETTSAASGSGFILTSDGYILTNYHVIEDSSDITVSTYDGTSYDAELVGYIENNDIAVLKIDATGLTPVVLGDSDNMNVGDSVVAIGNPLGELTFSLTSGAVSALNRSVTMSTGVTMNLIQTDCAINSGNSGGALFNMYGEVIGITNAKYSGSSSSSSTSIDNIGFAIPINQVKSMITSIIETGTYERNYIGITVSSMTMSTVYSTGLTSGAIVQSVEEDSPAESAGLEAGDIITQADGTDVSNGSTLSSIIASAQEGDELTLTVYRDGNTIEITVTIARETQSALTDSSDSSGSESSSQNYGQYEYPWGNYGGYSDSYDSDSESSGTTV